jgi:5-methylcytosine-specific restriction protein A
MTDKEHYRKMIQSMRWRRLRRMILTAHPLCQACAREGRLTPATEVHHVRPVDEVTGYLAQERRMFDQHNLVALCHDCHVQAHRDLGSWSSGYAQRRNVKQAEEVIDRLFGDDAEAKQSESPTG